MTANRAVALAALVLSLALFGCAASGGSSPKQRHGFYGGVSAGGGHI